MKKLFKNTKFHLLRNKSIAKIFYTSCVVFLTVVCAFLFSFIRLNVVRNRQETLSGISTVYNMLDYLLENQTELLAFTADIIAGDENIKPLIIGKEREKLYQYFEGFCQDINSRYGITHVYFHGLDRRKILRMYKPEKYGDLTNRFTFSKAVETKKVSSGLEIGSHGTFTLRLVQPVFFKKEVIGYVEVGKELDEIISLLKNYFTEEIAVVISKDKMNRLKWEKRPKKLKYDFEWNMFRDYALVYSTAKSVASMLVSFVEKGHALSNGGEAFKFNNQYVFLYLRPFLDASGAEVGKLVVSRNVTGMVKSDLIFVVVSVIAAFLVFIFIVSCFYAVSVRYDKSFVLAQDEFKKETEAVFASFSHIRDAVVWFDSEGHIVNCNKGVFNLLGFKKQELLGRCYWDICVPDRREEYKRAFADSWAGRNNNQDIKMLTKNGQEKVISVACSLVDIGGRKILQGILMDITVRHTLFTKYKESLMFFRNLVDAIPLPLYSVDKKGIYQVCNQAFASTLKREVDDVIGSSVEDVYPKNIAEKYLNFDKEAMEEKDSLSINDTLYVEGGDDRRVVFNKHAVVDAQGNIESVVSVVNEVLVSASGDSDLLRPDSELQAVLNNLGYGIILIDEDMHVLYMNRKMQQWFPYSHNIKDKNCYAVLDSSDDKTECRKCCVDKVFTQGKSISRKIEKMVDSKKRIFNVTACPVTGANGYVDKVVEIFEDITASPS